MNTFASVSHWKEIRMHKKLEGMSAHPTFPAVARCNMHTSPKLHTNAILIHIPSHYHSRSAILIRTQK